MLATSIKQSACTLPRLLRSGQPSSVGSLVCTACRAASAMPNALLHCDWMLKDQWAESIRASGIDLAVWPDLEDYDAITFFIGWRPPTGLLKQLKNLKAVQLLGAGVETLVNDPDLPHSVPLLRIADPLMGQRLATWVVWAIINTQRHFDTYLEHQRRRSWYKSLEGYVNKDNKDVSIGILGLGVMGRETAAALTALGYRVSSWTRNPREYPGVRNFSGREQLRPFVEQSEYLVCLLPLTPDTKHIIDAELLSWLPKGACVINGARGGHIVEADVLAALDSGQLGALVTDVTDPEPLPEDSELWEHPRVRLTPHVAAFTPIPTATAQIAENFRAVQAGKPLAPERVVDRSAGY